MSLLEMFCDVDDFCQRFLQSQQGRLLGHGEKKPGPKRRLSVSEVMTILILFHDGTIAHSSTSTSNTSCKTCAVSFRIWSAITALSKRRQRPCCLCAPISSVAGEPPPASASLMRRHWQSATIAAFLVTASLTDWPVRQDFHGLVLWLQIACHRQ